MNENQYFHIENLSHIGYYLAAGFKADNHLYLQLATDLNDTPNAMWCFEKFDNLDKKPGGVFYRIADKKHNMAIAAGDSADGHVYHQKRDNRLVEMWDFEYTIKEGMEGFLITDARHRLSLTAGAVYDGTLYHQPTALTGANSLWAFIPVGEISPENYPDFMFWALNTKLQDFKQGDPVTENLPPEVVVNLNYENNNDTEQFSSNVLTVTDTETHLFSVTESITKEKVIQAIEKITSKIGLSKISSVTIEGSSSQSWKKSTTESLSNEVSYSRTVSFQVKQDITMRPHSQVPVQVTLNKRKTSIPYEATFLAEVKNSKGEIIKITKTINGIWESVKVIDSSIVIKE